ncbi:MAG TPA: glycosyltransferase, partial [Candidatus Omnitrophota bacterium]|nr:glycosyltransferase [Candidatus Omnitrophota bacterium]
MKERIGIISLHGSPLASLGDTDAGGQNVYIAHLAKNLSKKYLVDIFTRKHRPGQAITHKDGYRVVYIDAGPASEIPKEKLMPYLNEFSLNLKNFITKNKLKFKLMHANFFDSGRAAIDIKKEKGTPFIITFHALGRIRRHFQGDKDNFPDDRFLIEEEIMKLADGIIAECPQDKEDMINLYKAKEEKIRMIPCGYDPVELMPVPKEEARFFLGIPPEKKVILQLGRMVQRKGIENVIKAHLLLVKFYRYDAQLLIIGGETASNKLKTAEIERLEPIVKRLGLAKRVNFMGKAKRDMLKFFYSAADIFVSTPWYEPFGITPLEAMACKTPV